MICRLTVYSRLEFSSSDKLGRRPRKAAFSGQPWARVKERDTDRKTEAAAYAVIYLVLYLWKVMVKVSQDIHPFNSSSSKSNAAYTVKLLSISQMSPGPWGSTQCECVCVCVCVCVDGSHKDTQELSWLSNSLQYSRSMCEEGCGHLLYLLCVFVANENDDWVNVNVVKPFHSVRCNVKQTVTVLRERSTQHRTGLSHVTHKQHERLQTEKRASDSTSTNMNLSAWYSSN